MLDGLLWEPTLSDTVELGLGGSADMACESSVRNAVSVLENVFQVLNGALKLEALDGSRSFISVLEVSSQICDSGLSGYD